MAHIVKCLYCNEQFNRDKIPCIQIGRRYAHEDCVNKQNTNIIQEDKDKEHFYEIVKQIYGKNYNFMMINKQATSYIQQYGYTWSGMAKCLNWFYNINHNSLEEGHGGIGIIPYIWDEVYKYYYDLYKAQEKNKRITAQNPVIEFNIQSPRSYKQLPHLLNLEEEEDETG